MQRFSGLVVLLVSSFLVVFAGSALSASALSVEESVPAGAGEAAAAPVAITEPADAEAQFLQGVRYAHGDGVAQDDVQAAQWFTKAAEQGHAEAQYNLGIMNAQGQGVRVDSEQAFQWFSKAAEQDHTEAQYSLGVMYAKGEGVTSDYAHAVEWYTKAAEHGHAKAQFNLGVLYAKGEEVPQDLRLAYIWFSVAEASGKEGAVKNRDWVEAKLSAEELEKAKADAAEFVTKYAAPPVE